MTHGAGAMICFYLLPKRVFLLSPAVGRLPGAGAGGGRLRTEMVDWLHNQFDVQSAAGKAKVALLVRSKAGPEAIELAGKPPTVHPPNCYCV